MVIQYVAMYSTYGCSSYVFSQVGTTQVDRLDEDLERIAPSEVGVHNCAVFSLRTPIDILCL